VNNRRKLIIALGAFASVAPLPSLAQPRVKVWRVAILAPRSKSIGDRADPYREFDRGLYELGYVEGKNLQTEWRYAEGKFDRLPSLAIELVRLRPDVIVTIGPQATGAAQKATKTIPIVMVVSNDPVASGLVGSLARPGGNITGLSNLSGSLSQKHLEMLVSMVPRVTRIGVLVNPTNSGGQTMVESISAAADKARIKVRSVQASTPQEIEDAFALLAQDRSGAVIVMLDPMFIQHRSHIASLAAKHRLPSLSPFREYAEVGGLMSYGQDLGGQYRRMTMFVDKIFKGAKPGDLPVEQPTKLELVINGKTAKALGLTIPHSLLISADKVID